MPAPEVLVALAAELVLVLLPSPDALLFPSDSVVKTLVTEAEDTDTDTEAVDVTVITLVVWFEKFDESAALEAEMSMGEMGVKMMFVAVDVEREVMGLRVMMVGGRLRETVGLVEMVMDNSGL